MTSDNNSLTLISSTLIIRFHCVRGVRIRTYFGPYFPEFELHTERYGVSLRIHSECGKIRTRITPNMGTFHAVLCLVLPIYLYINQEG